MEKTHYRKVFKSDHLGIADLEDLIEEGKRLVFTVKEVKQEYGASVAGKKIDANIAYFKEPIKPLVLNATNSKIMKSFNNNSPFVEDWKNTVIELYIDPNVKMKGDTVGGVRIKPTRPAIAKPELIPTMVDEWKRAIAHLKGSGTIDDIKKRYVLSVANENILKDATI
ncbi:MAG TPA: hypothetical protein VN192_02860 [Flavobacterium sp.]|nr:hypothetical protein [Flavobacterium sp.]